jgi:hypothetical protein
MLSIPFLKKTNLKRKKRLKNISFFIVALLFNQPICADSIELPQYCSLQGGLVANGIQVLNSSGNPDLDRSIDLELTHLAESFNVLPGFGFYDDKNGFNAFATKETVEPNTRGTVVFGKRLLSNELAQHSWGGLAIAGIMAHEFAHIYQMQTEFYQLLLQSQPTHKLLELHADYLAGYYLGLKRLRSGDIDIKAFLDSLYLKGDTHFYSPGHHGTPSERKDAMLEGYKMGLTHNLDIHEVAIVGMNLVKKM